MEGRRGTGARKSSTFPVILLFHGLLWPLGFAKSKNGQVAYASTLSRLSVQARLVSHTLSAALSEWDLPKQTQPYRVPAAFQLELWNIADWRALLILQAERCNIRFRVTSEQDPTCHVLSRA